MGRGLAGRPVACAVHPHRPATDRCDECRRPFCRECFAHVGARLLCRACAAAVPARQAEAARRRSVSYRVALARQRLREQGRAVALAGAAGLLLVALGAGTVGVWWFAGAAAGRRPVAGQAAPLELPGLTERLAVERYCTGGGGTLTAEPEPQESGTAGAVGPEGGPYVADAVGVLPPLVGGDVPPTPAPGGASADFDPMNLVRSQGPHARGWRSADAVLPQQVGFALRPTASPVSLDRVAFWHTTTLPPESWARDVVLLVSAVAPDREFRVVGRWTLGQTTEVQTFSFVAVRARFVRLCLQSRHGQAEFVSLGGFNLGVLTGTVVADARRPGPLPPASRRPWN